MFLGLLNVRTLVAVNGALLISLIIVNMIVASTFASDIQARYHLNQFLE